MKTRDKVAARRDAEALRQSASPGPRHYLPTVDVIETDDEVLLLANMPGVEADNAEVSVQADKLRIAGRADLDLVPPEFKPLSLEFGPGRFARTLKVHEHVDADGIRAQLKNGVLRITLPRRDVHSGRVIEINKE